MRLFNKYLLQTQTSQRASIQFRDGTMLHMDQRTDALLSTPNVTLVKKGQVAEVLAPGTNHRVQTATAVAAAIGTEFLVRVIRHGSYFIVVHGSLEVKNKLGSVTVTHDEGSKVIAGKPPAEPQHVDAEKNISWTQPLPVPHIGDNVALSAGGGHIAGFSSQRSSAAESDYWNSRYLIDGRTDFGWESAPGSVSNQWVKVQLAGNAPQTITKIIIDPAATHDDTGGQADLKDFQIRVSSTDTADSSFKTVLTGHCAHQDSLQSFALSSPVSAKYVELFAVNNYGSPDETGVAEMEVISAPS